MLNHFLTEIPISDYSSCHSWPSLIAIEYRSMPSWIMKNLFGAASQHPSRCIHDVEIFSQIKTRLSSKHQFETPSELS